MDSHQMGTPVAYCFLDQELRMAAKLRVWWHTLGIPALLLEASCDSSEPPRKQQALACGAKGVQFLEPTCGMGSSFGSTASKCADRSARRRGWRCRRISQRLAYLAASSNSEPCTK